MDKYPRKSIGLPPEMWGEIAKYRHKEMLRSEREAIIRLLRYALDNQGASTQAVKEKAGA